MQYTLDIDFAKFHNPYNGLYIALEGLDGSGKTVQTQRLKAYFESQGREVLMTREPRKQSGLLAELNSKILLGHIQVPSSAYQYLFTAERILHHQELIIPSLKEGKVVISDRCFWSAIPYGVLDYDSYDVDTVARQLIFTQAVPLQHHQVTSADVVFYLKVSREESLKRIPRKINEYKEVYETEEKLGRIETGYAWLLKHLPDEFVTIDANRSIEEVTQDMVEYLGKFKK